MALHKGVEKLPERPERLVLGGRGTYTSYGEPGQSKRLYFIVLNGPFRRLRQVL
jgi:hypothetical protein